MFVVRETCIASTFSLLLSCILRKLLYLWQCKVKVQKSLTANNNAQLSYQRLDRCFSDFRHKYAIDELIASVNDRLVKWICVWYRRCLPDALEHKTYVWQSYIQRANTMPLIELRTQKRQ